MTTDPLSLPPMTSTRLTDYHPRRREGGIADER